MRKKERGGLVLIAAAALVMALGLVAIAVDHNEPTAPAGFNVQSNQAVKIMASRSMQSAVPWSAADLDFTSGDYSIGCWLKWSSEDESQIVIGRYVVDTSGWENYLYEGDTTRLLTTRHHHAAGDAVRTACYSGGWTQDVWWFLGISRSGSSVTHYRNGEALSMSCSAGGIVDPESNSSDLVVGVRTTKDDNYFNGSMYRMRVWSRAIELAEWARIYDHEKHWFE